MRSMRSFAFSFLFAAALAACDGGPDTTTSTTGSGGGTGGSGGNVTSSTSSSSTTTSSSSGGETGGGGADGGTPVWSAPACTSVKGTAAVTFTLDEGATLAPTELALQGVGYTFGLVALDAPNTLVAEHQGTVYRSTDAGCTWASIGQVAHSPLTLVAAKGGRAYAFSDNYAYLYRIDGAAVTALKAPATAIVGLGVDPADGDHLRLGDGAGSLWESTDAGAQWSPIGVPVPTTGPALVYRFAFDPTDLDHALVGLAVDGAFETENGGSTWTQVTGLAAGDANVFSIAIAKSEGKVVWAQGIDLEKTNEPVFEGRTLWRSTDGGLSFSPVVEQTAEITLVNGTLLAPHPTQPGILYFVFGTYFQGYGTDIYRYDHGNGQVTKTHNTYNDVSSIAFSPADPQVMYLGLTKDAPN